MLKKAFVIGSALASLMVPAAAQAQYYGHHDRNYYRDSSHYYYDGHHYRDRNSNAVIDTLIGGLIGYGLGAATTSGYGYAAPAYNYGYAQPAYGYGYAQPAYGYPQVMVVPGYTFSNGYYWDSYGHRYSRRWMDRRYGRR